MVRISACKRSAFSKPVRFCGAFKACSAGPSGTNSGGAAGSAAGSAAGGAAGGDAGGVPAGAVSSGYDTRSPSPSVDVTLFGASGVSAGIGASGVGAPGADPGFGALRSEEHTSELQSLMRISYAVFCLKKNKQRNVDRQTS